MNKKKQIGFLKWPMYILFALLLFCIQYSPTKLGIFDGAMLILPFIVTLCCFEEIIPSVITCACFGFLWDYSGGHLFGFRAFMLCIIGLCVCLAIKLYVRPVFVSVMAAVAIATIVYIIAEFFFFYVIKGYSSLFSLFVNNYIWAFFKTVLWGTLISYLTMKIYKLKPQKSLVDM